MNFNHISRSCADALGSSKAFFLALIVVLVWGLCGPLFAFSTTWQLVINTSTTIITFLAVFLIQNAQNTDTRAIHVKLDELIKIHEEADNRFVRIEQGDKESVDKLDRLHDA